MIRNRLAVWALETLCEALLIAGFLVLFVALRAEDTSVLPPIGPSMLIWIGALATLVLMAMFGLQEQLIFRKRLAVWAFETLCEALFIGILLVIFILFRAEDTSGLAPIGPRWLIGIGMLAIPVLMVMFGSGFLVTTLIFNGLLRNKRMWVYPIIATILFVFHVKYYFADGWPFSNAPPIELKIGGAGIVFLCTSVGNLLLRKWTKTGDSPSSVVRQP
jgi:hypothetical protein